MVTTTSKIHAEKENRWFQVWENFAEKAVVIMSWLPRRLYLQGSLS